MYFEPSVGDKDVATFEELSSMLLIPSEFKNAQYIFDRIYGWAMEYGGGYIGASKAVTRFEVEYNELSRKINKIIR